MEGQGDSSKGYLLWIWKPTGYELEERRGEPPSIGSELDQGDLHLRVTKVGPSPLPGDARPCAYTISVR